MESQEEKNVRNDDNRANQLNPNHEEYKGSDEKDRDYANDNRANQLNPNHEEYKGQ